MEQQLKHLCEGRPFDVLCVDNTQKCSTQAGSEKGAGERLQEGVVERQRERMRETKAVLERSSHSFCHEMKKKQKKNTTIPHLAALRHNARISLHYLC